MHEWSRRGVARETARLIRGRWARASAPWVAMPSRRVFNDGRQYLATRMLLPVATISVSRNSIAALLALSRLHPLSQPRSIRARCKSTLETPRSRDVFLQRLDSGSVRRGGHAFGRERQGKTPRQIRQLS